MKRPISMAELAATSLPDKAARGLRIGTGAWYVLVVLIGMYAMHSVDRSVMSVLMEPIKREFRLTDTQAGALNSLIHGVAYALGVLPIGLLGDRVNRVRLIAVLSAVWSSLTIACGFAPGAVILATSRAGVGFAEAGFAPNALSLIGDVFPRKRRATAVGLFYGSTAIGTGLIFSLGAYVANLYGWRAAFLLAGLPGLALAALILATVREPVRGGFDPTPETGRKIGLRATLAEIAGNRALLCGVGGTVLGTITVASVWAWGVSFFVRAHGLSLTSAGTILAIVAGPTMALASVVAGPLTDRLAAVSPRQMTLVPAAALLLTVPAGLIALASYDLTVSVGAMAFFGLLQGAWLAQGFGTVLATTRPQVRSGVMSVTQLFTNLVGTGLGPLVAGMLSDRLGGGGDALRAALSLIVLLGVPGSALLWFAGRLQAETSE